MTSTDATQRPPPHARAAEEVPGSLGVDPGRGLDDVEAQRRLRVDGPNVIETAGGPGRLALLLDELRSPLVWLLVAAGLVSGLLLDEWVDAGVVYAIVVLNAALGYVQHARAEEALARLREITAPEAVVLRDGRERRVDAAGLVVGDVIVLEAGDRVPADARLLECRRLRTDEAALTGESLPVTKHTAAVPAEAVIGDRCSMVFTGTSVVVGRGRAVVTATGRATEVGAIARMMEQQREEPTPLEARLGVVGRRLAFLAVGVAVLVFGLGSLRDYAADEMFLTAVALAVAAIPEGLPAVVTITLARGMARMARRHALVRRLPAVETLGSASVVCTDKTGTLTRNELRVHRLVLDGEARPDEVDLARASTWHYARIASLCNDARRSGDGYLGDPIEIALLRSVAAAGLDPERIRARHPRLDELAFDSARKRMTTLHELDDGFLVAVKGAPEVLLARSSALVAEDGARPLGPAERRERAAAAAGLAERGLRTLAVAYRVVATRPGDPEALEGLEDDLVFAGVVGMLDELRDEARPAVEEARRAGIRVVMVTGDHPATARAIADDLGLLDDGGEVMPGADLAALPTEELERGVERLSVYARVDPTDKVKIVDAWKRRGEVVAMTGDGVNDAPALRAADIGVAMGSGTDVGKEAADMVLTDDNFASIVAAVREGRRIFLNLEKVVWFLLSANAAEVLLMTVGFLAFGGLGTPLLPTQILWVNLVTDGLPVLALAVDPAPPGIMRRRPFAHRELLGRTDQLRMLLRGAVLASAAVGALVVGHHVRDLPWPRVRTLVFTTLVVVQLLYAFAVRRTGDGRVTLRSNPWLLAAVAGSLLLQLVVVQTPLGTSLFDTEPLDLLDWAVALGLSLAAVLLVAVVAGWRDRRREPPELALAATAAGAPARAGP
ncbi:MAG: cation-translocating P-type ATPase [Acidimicrobiia bacterium]|nr:cation-translocating P-type ATPase [Acidimicrobiia bacterium]